MGCSPQYKKLTPAELKAKREKGLCYYCDDKYSPSHRYKTSFFLLVREDKVKELLKDDELEDVQDAIEPEKDIKIMEVNAGISLNALDGQFHPSTFHVTGNVLEKRLKFWWIMEVTIISLKPVLLLN